MKLEKDWNFDEIIDRQNTGSVKWDPDVLVSKYGAGKEKLLPFWVADMDFKSPSVVTQAFEKRITHPLYGYTAADPSYYTALTSWFSRRYQWDIDESWILTSPGVIPSLNYFIHQVVSPGEKVLIQTPVYYPFAESIVKNGFEVVDNPLLIVDGGYRMDFEDLKAKTADPKVKLAILCSPHNPVGRVWTEEELKKFGEICIENEVLVFADEIHCDLTMPGSKQIFFQNISEEFARHSVSANAVSKTFNIAGLHQSSLIIPDEGMRKRFSSYFEKFGMEPRGCKNLFGSIAAVAAYNHAEAWLDDLLLYIHENYLYMKSALEKNLPGVKVFKLEGTFLTWVDFRALGLSENRIIQHLFFCTP